MKKLIVLRGNSGSGKTTIAKELQKKFGKNTMLISQDVIRRDILKVPDGENTLAIPLMKELLIYGNGHSDIVILEGIMYANWYKPL
ncbi:MAG: kinase, partial [Lachnospiraceae bacterium]|nr:kinase [Lachnospiraceae bacterium]